MSVPDVKSEQSMIFCNGKKTELHNPVIITYLATLNVTE